MDRLNASKAPAPVRPVKVLQFGEGNFLRAFVDYFVDIANEKTDFNGSIVLVKPIGLPLHRDPSGAGERGKGGKDPPDHLRFRRRGRRRRI